MAVVTGLQNEYNAATDQAFLPKVEMAVLNAAAAIASEAIGSTPSSTDVNHHANRMALCKAVTQPGASTQYGAAFAKLIMALATTDNTLDTAIQNAVNSVWNVVAGQP